MVQYTDYKSQFPLFDGYSVEEELQKEPSSQDKE